jgi:hypothetical protein
MRDRITTSTKAAGYFCHADEATKAPRKPLDLAKAITARHPYLSWGGRSVERHERVGSRAGTTYFTSMAADHLYTTPPRTTAGSSDSPAAVRLVPGKPLSFQAKAGSAAASGSVGTGWLRGHQEEPPGAFLLVPSGAPPGLGVTHSTCSRGGRFSRHPEAHPFRVMTVIGAVRVYVR